MVIANVPEYEYYGLYGMIVLLIVAWIKYYMNLKRDAPEALAFSKARKQKMPLIEIQDDTGNGFLDVMKLDTKGAPFASGDEFGLQVNPRLTSTQQPDRINGLPVLRFKTKYHFPLSGNNAKAYHDALDYVRLKHENLSFLDDLEVMVYLGKTKDKLNVDVANLLKIHKDETTLTETEIIKEIEAAQSELMKLPIKEGFYTYNYAFRLIPTALTSQDFRQLKQYLERLIRMEMSGELTKILVYAMALAGILIAGGIVYKITSQA